MFNSLMVLRRSLNSSSSKDHSQNDHPIHNIRQFHCMSLHHLSSSFIIFHHLSSSFIIFHHLSWQKTEHLFVKLLLRPSVLPQKTFSPQTSMCDPCPPWWYLRWRPLVFTGICVPQKCTKKMEADQQVLLRGSKMSRHCGAFLSSTPGLKHLIALDWMIRI